MPIENSEAELRLGSVDGQFVTMRFSIVISADGSARVRIFMAEQRGRRGGELIDLGASGLRELREMVDHIEATIARLCASGQIRSLKPGS